MFARPRPAALLWEARTPVPGGWRPAVIAPRWCPVELLAERPEGERDGRMACDSRGPRSSRCWPTSTRRSCASTVRRTITFASSAVARLTGHDPGSLVGAVHRRLRAPRRPGRAAAPGRALARPHRAAAGSTPSTHPGRRRGLGPRERSTRSAATTSVRSARSWPRCGWSMPATESSRSCAIGWSSEGRLVRIASSFVHLPSGQVDDGVDARAGRAGQHGRGRPGRDRPVRRAPARPCQHPRVGGAGRASRCAADWVRPGRRTSPSCAPSRPTRR